MKVVHLSTQDIHGGAFRGAYWLHEGLRKEGVDSQMLVARRFTDDSTVHLSAIKPFSYIMYRWRKWKEAQGLKPYQNRSSNDIFSPAVVSANLTNALRRFDPDIIHLHWVTLGF